VYKTAQCHNPEDHNLNNHCYGNNRNYIGPCLLEGWTLREDRGNKDMRIRQAIYVIWWMSIQGMNFSHMCKHNHLLREWMLSGANILLDLRATTPPVLYKENKKHSALQRGSILTSSTCCLSIDLLLLLGKSVKVYQLHKSPYPRGFHWFLTIVKSNLWVSVPR
jgi:hypothetical protein